MADDDEEKEEAALGIDECDTTVELELVEPDVLCPEEAVVEVVVLLEVVNELEVTEEDNDPGLGWDLSGRSLNKFHGCCCS